MKNHRTVRYCLHPQAKAKSDKLFGPDVCHHLGIPDDFNKRPNPRSEIIKHFGSDILDPYYAGLYFVSDGDVYSLRRMEIKPEKPDDHEDGCCYMYIHKESSKVYIGSTKCLKKRRGQHRSDARLKKCRFHELLIKEGEDAFDIETICEGKMRDMRRFEKEMIGFMQKYFPSDMFNIRDVHRDTITSDIIRPIVHSCFLKLGHLWLLRNFGDFQRHLERLGPRKRDYWI